MSQIATTQAFYEQLPALVAQVTGQTQRALPVRVDGKMAYIFSTANNEISVHPVWVDGPLTRLLESPNELSRVDMVESKRAFTRMIRAQLRATAEATAADAASSVRWRYPIEDGVWHMSATKCVDAVADATGLTERQPSFAAVDSPESNLTNTHALAVEALTRGVAQALGMEPDVLLMRMLRLHRGDAIVTTLVNMIIENAGITAASTVMSEIVRPAITTALTAPFEPLDRYLQTPNLPPGLGDQAGTLAGQRAAADALATATALSCISLEALAAAPTRTPARTLRVAAVKAGFRGDARATTPHTISSAQELFDAAPAITSEIFGSTCHVSTIDTSDSLAQAYPHFNGDYRLLKPGEATVRLHNTKTAAPIESLFDSLSASEEGSTFLADLVRSGDDSLARRSLGTLFHECIHGLGSADDAQFFGTWAATFPGSRVVREGVTQLCSEAFFPDFLAAIGLGDRARDLLATTPLMSYPGESAAMALLLTTAAQRCHIAPRDLLREAGARGDGREAVAVMAEAFVRGRLYQGKAGKLPLTSVASTAHAIETAMEGLDKALPDATSQAQRSEAGMDAASSAIRGIDQVLATLHPARPAQPQAPRGQRTAPVLPPRQMLRTQQGSPPAPTL